MNSSRGGRTEKQGPKGEGQGGSQKRRLCESPRNDTASRGNLAESAAEAKEVQIWLQWGRIFMTLFGLRSRWEAVCFGLLQLFAWFICRTRVWWLAGGEESRVIGVKIFRGLG